MELSLLKSILEGLEAELYDAPRCYGTARDLLTRAEAVFDNVLNHYDLSYFNPGEPEAINEDRSIVIPLTGNNGEMYSSEEEERILAGDWELPGDLYWARLRVQQARDVLDIGWQYGLEID